MKRVDVVYACIRNKDNQILMVYNQDAGHWSMPGGKVEQGEFLNQALIREVKEETGYDVAVEDVISINERKIVSSKEHALFLTFSCEILGGKLLISDPKEISKIEWVDFDKANKYMPYHPQGVETLMIERTKYTNQGEY